jgi:hypothetical protein
LDATADRDKDGRMVALSLPRDRGVFYYFHRRAVYIKECFVFIQENFYFLRLFYRLDKYYGPQGLEFIILHNKRVDTIIIPVYMGFW